jgi:hypothetical protein
MAAPVAQSVSPGDVLLLLADGANGPYELDPIRLMKGAFLVAQIGRQEWRSLFHFRAYDYGPFDVTVYRARDGLVTDGLLERDASGQYESYALSGAGRERAAALRHELGDDAEWVRSIGSYVTSRSFSTLIREIYEKYPQYAERSLFRQ